MALEDQGKGSIDDMTLAEKNRILDEEVKALTLKLKKSEVQIENLQCQVREFEEEVKTLKLGITGTVDADVSDFFKIRDLLEEENKSLRLEHLELTVQHHMQTMWNFILLKLENPEGHMDELRTPISNPPEAEEARILKSEMNFEQTDVTDVSKSSLEKENKSLRLELLELTVKYHMRKMWKMINMQLKEVNLLRGKQWKQKSIASDSDSDDLKIWKDEQLISTVIHQEKVPTETNPFENERIVSHIMGYVNPKDLPKCRQVCKLWRKAAQKDFEGRVTFYVTNTRNELFKIPLFMDAAAKSFPTFRNLKFYLDCNAREVDKKIVSALFLKHGKQLHKLELDFGGTEYCGGSWSLDDFRDIFLNSLEEIREFHVYMSCQLIHRGQMFLSHHERNILMNLTTLNIGVNCRDCRSMYHKISEIFFDLLRLIPNMKELSWGSWGAEGVEDVSTNFIQSLIHVNPIKLEKLFIRSFIPDYLLASIASCDLILNQLNLFDVHSFKLELISSAYRKRKLVSGLKIKFPRNMNPILKSELENALAHAYYRNVSCTDLLHVFMTKLTQYRGFERVRVLKWLDGVV